jgi:hypothetical protein
MSRKSIKAVVRCWSSVKALSHSRPCGGGRLRLRSGRVSAAQAQQSSARPATHRTSEVKVFADPPQKTISSTENLFIITCSERGSRKWQPRGMGGTLIRVQGGSSGIRCRAEDLHELKIAAMDSRYWFLDTLSLVSLGRGGRYPWWFLVVVAVYAVAEMFRHRHEAGGWGVAECLARQQFFGGTS